MKFNPNEIVFGLQTRKFKPNEYMCLYSICNVAYEHKVIVLNLFFLNQLAVQHYNWCNHFIYALVWTWILL